MKASPIRWEYCYISACLKRSGFTNIGYVDHICMLRKMEEMKNDPSRGFMLQGMPETRKNNLDDLLKYLKERQPHIILLGPITSFHLVELTDLVPRLREQFPEQLIIAGGPHFGKEDSLDTELLETCTGLDAIIVGEAEETVVEVANLYQKNCRNNEALLSIGEFKTELSEILGIHTQGNIPKRGCKLACDRNPKTHGRSLKTLQTQMDALVNPRPQRHPHNSPRKIH